MRHTVDILPFFFVLFFCFGPDDVTLFRSISKRKQKKEEKVPNTTTPTPSKSSSQSSGAEKHPKGGRANQTAFSGKKTREEETKREVKRKRDERDGGEGWRRFWRDLEFDDDDDDDGTTTTTTLR